MWRGETSRGLARLQLRTRAPARRRASSEVERGSTPFVGHSAYVHGDVTVVSHGLVLSLYLARLEGRPRPDVAAWAAIPLPAVAGVDPTAPRVVRPFAAVEDVLGGSGD